MKGARFLVARGTDTSWGRTGIDGGDPSPAPRGDWYSWLLIGGNNRELARGTVPFATEQACRTALRQLPTLELRPVMTSSSRALLWAWRLDGPDGPVACGGRIYRRRRECLYAVSVAVEVLALALPPTSHARTVSVSWALWRKGGVAGDAESLAAREEAPALLVRRAFSADAAQEMA